MYYTRVSQGLEPQASKRRRCIVPMALSHRTLQVLHLALGLGKEAFHQSLSELLLRSMLPGRTHLTSKGVALLPALDAKLDAKRSLRARNTSAAADCKAAQGDLPCIKARRQPQLGRCCWHIEYTPLRHSRIPRGSTRAGHFC